MAAAAKQTQQSGGPNEDCQLLFNDLADAFPSMASRRGNNVKYCVGITLAGLFAVVPFGYAGFQFPETWKRIPKMSVRELMTMDTRSCSDIGQDCSASRCCKTKGLQCFKKHDSWSGCRASCSAGPDPTDTDPLPWNCMALGPKTPGSAPAPYAMSRVAKWVEQNCSSSSEDCRKTWCCKEAGKKCFKKNDGWYGCRDECVPGPDPLDVNNDTWDCTGMGMRTPGQGRGSDRKAAAWVQKWCSAKSENCLATKCCKDAGHQCFLKEDGWAMCRPSCMRGPHLTDVNSRKWVCTALGGRTPGKALPEPVPKQLAKWVKLTCSNDGENCTDTRCCAHSTQQCYSKNVYWAACMQSCKPGIHEGDKDMQPWNCDKLGPRTPRERGSPSLYCFSVIRLTTYEAAIIKKQVSTDGGIGIFGCDMYDVFAAKGRGWIGDGPNGPIWTKHFMDAPVTRSIDNTAGNTALFRNVWRAVKQVGNWAVTDWTVKVDPDAVLFADRLRSHLRPHTGKAVFIQNCASSSLVQQGGVMMFGSVEAISHQGIDKYFNAGGEQKCDGNNQYGEDRWLGECFKGLGVYPVTDVRVLGDKLCLPGIWNCGDGRAVYHYYKNVTSWMNCYSEGKGTTW